MKQAPQLATCLPEPKELRSGRRGLLVGLAGLFAPSLVRADEQGEALRRILERRELRIAINLGRPPFASRDAAGELVGFDIAIGRLLAAGLGVEPRFIEAPVTGRLPLMLAGEADLICHMPLSAEFSRRMLLTSPYMRVDISLASPTWFAVRRLNDLEDRSIGVLIGSGAELAANEVLPMARRLVLCSDMGCAGDSLAARQVDALVVARASLIALQRSHPEWTLVHRFVLRQRYISLGVSFGEHDLLRVLNGLIFLARTQGRLSALSEAHLGFPLPELPSF